MIFLIKSMHSIIIPCVADVQGHSGYYYALSGRILWIQFLQQRTFILEVEYRFYKCMLSYHRGQVECMYGK